MKIAVVQATTARSARCCELLDIVVDACPQTYECEFSHGFHILYFFSAGPSSVQIKGPDSVNITRKYAFTCVAECGPSCRFAWLVEGQTLRGSQIEIVVEQHMKSFTLNCEAQNTVSKKTTKITKTIFVGGI